MRAYRSQDGQGALDGIPTATFQGQRPPHTSLPNWLAGRATALEIAVLWALQFHYPDVRPSLNRLAEVTGLARRTVSKVVLDLERKGWLARVQLYSDTGRKLSNRYELRIWDPPLHVPDSDPPGYELVPWPPEQLADAIPWWRAQ